MSADGMALRAFRHLVTEALGLEFDGDKVGEFESALRATQKQLGLSDLASLFNSLEAAPPMGELWQPLRERLTVGESYFFRDPNQLEVIRREVLEAWAIASQPRRVRLWSAGCSSGEEAYTLAMLAIDALPSTRGWHVEVLGTDLSESALHRARSGRYRPWSFRGMGREFQERWFTESRDEWTVSPAIRGVVQFKHHNLTQECYEPLAGPEGFDLILCRNVFIYFPSSTTRLVVRRFADVLSPQGVLVLGHSELVGDAPSGFTAEHHSHSTLLRRVAPQPELQPLRPAYSERAMPHARLSSPANVRRGNPDAPKERTRDTLKAARLALAARDHRSALEHAKSHLQRHPRDEAAARIAIQVLANQGNGEEAQQLLAKHLAFHPGSTSLHYLRSLLAAEHGDEPAVHDALEDVLRLSPDHVAALMDRARIHEAHGRLPEALRDLKRASEVAATLDPAGPVEGLEPFKAGEVAPRCLDLISQLETRMLGCAR